MIRTFVTMLWRHPPDLQFVPRAGLYLLKVVVTVPIFWLEKLIWGRKLRMHQPHPEPLFVLGYYRSGTTYLQRLLTQNPDYAYLTTYEALVPYGMLLLPSILPKIVNKVLAWLGVKHPAHPHIALHMAFPSEEDIAFINMVSPVATNWGHIFPKAWDQYFPRSMYFENICEQDAQRFRDDYLELIKRISFAKGGKPLVLKSLPNTARIAQLVAMFPRAKFIYLHRAPEDVFPSNVKLWESTFAHHLQNVSPEQIEDIIFVTYRKIRERYLAERELIPQGQLIEVQYEQLLEHPMAVMAQIYKTLKLPNFDRFRQRLEPYIRENHGKGRSTHQLSEALRHRIHQEWGNPAPIQSKTLA